MEKDTLPTKEEWLEKVSGAYVLKGEALEFAKDKDLTQKILEELDKKIKFDQPVKLSVFFAGISAFLKEPINLFQKGASGIGKSYNTVQTLKFFPQDNLWLLGGLSPKALIHDYGVLLTGEGLKVEDIEKPEKPKKSDFAETYEFEDQMRLYKQMIKGYREAIRESYTLIDLSQKILVFLETPEYGAFRMLYPILSHDTERIEYRFVDKMGKGQLRTMRVIIQGFPATIFLTIDKKYMEELATRSFTITPEKSTEKIEAANKLTNSKVSYPWKNTESETATYLHELLLSIQTWFKVYNAEVIIPFDNLYELFPKEIVRDMRDFQHFTQLLMTITALHLHQRPIITLKQKYMVVSSVFDVLVALNIYKQIFETTRTGTEQEILDFYHTIVKQKSAWYLKDLTAEYNLANTPKRSSETLRLKLERLIEIGYVDVEKDENDKRLNVYKPLMKHGEEKAKTFQDSFSWLILKPKLEKGFENWLNNIHKISDVQINKKNSNVLVCIGIEELRDMVLNEKFFSIHNPLICGLFSTPKQSLETENKQLNNQTTETCQVLDISKIKSLLRLTTDCGVNECSLCKQKKVSVGQIDYFDGSWGFVCEDCYYKLEKMMIEKE